MMQKHIYILNLKKKTNQTKKKIVCHIFAYCKNEQKKDEEEKVLLSNSGRNKTKKTESDGVQIIINKRISRLYHHMIRAFTHPIVV